MTPPRGRRLAPDLARKETISLNAKPRGCLSDQRWEIEINRSEIEINQPKIRTIKRRSMARPWRSICPCWPRPL
jgi:hypothetical protein